MNNNNLAENFEKLLNTTQGEREVTKFIDENIDLLYWAICPESGHNKFILKEFGFGKKFRTDFVIINSYSGTWNIHFIEFEPVNSNIFTKSGVPEKRLAGAIKQIHDWKEYCTRFEGEVRRDIVSDIKTKDLLKYDEDTDNPSNGTDEYLSCTETNLNIKYHIFIGRSTKLNKEQLRLKGRFYSNHNIELITYDRILKVIQNRQ